MRFLIDATLIIALLFGGKFALPKVYFEIKKMTLTKISKGLPSLGPFTKKLQGIEISEFGKNDLKATKLKQSNLLKSQ